MLNFLSTLTRWRILPCIYLNWKVLPMILGKQWDLMKWDGLGIVNHDYRYTISEEEKTRACTVNPHTAVMKQQHSKTLLLWIKKGRLSSHRGEYGVFFQNALCFIMNTTLTSHCILLSLQASTKAVQKSSISNGSPFRCWMLVSEEDTIHPLVSWGKIRNTHSDTRLGTTVQLPQTEWHGHKAVFSGD